MISDQPLQALPVLEVDGKKFCQGAAMARYLAREFGKLSSLAKTGLVVGALRPSVCPSVRNTLEVPSLCNL